MRERERAEDVELTDLVLRTTQTLVNLVKVYLGSGILGLPYAFREGGLLVRYASCCVVWMCV